MKLKLKLLFYLIYNILIIQVLTQEKGSSLRKTETLSIDFQKNEKITVHSNKEKIIFNCSEFKKDEEIYFKITAKRFIDEKIKFEFLDNLNGYFSIFHNLYNAYYTEKDDGLDKEVNYYTIKKSFYNVGLIQGKYLLIKFYCEGDVEIENIEKKENKESLEETEKSNTKDIIISIVAAIIVLAGIIALIYYCYKKKRNTIINNKKVLYNNRKYNIYNGYNYNQANQNFYYQAQMPQIQINQNNDINIDNGTFFRDNIPNSTNNNNFNSERNQINKRNNDNNGYSNSGGIFNYDHNSNNNDCNRPNNNINNQQDNDAQLNAINTSISFNNNNNSEQKNNNNENDDNNISNCLPSLEEINRAKRNIPQNDNNCIPSQTSENLGAPEVAYNSNQAS